MKLIEFVYQKPKEGNREYQLLELGSSVSYISGIALDKLTEEERNDLLIAYKNLEEKIEMYTKTAFRQFKIGQIKNYSKETLYHIYNDYDEAEGLFDSKGNLIYTIDVYHGGMVDENLLEQLGYEVKEIDFLELINEDEKEDTDTTDEIPNLKLLTKRLKEHIKEHSDDK
jgi:hypothetical protein